MHAVQTAAALAESVTGSAATTPEGEGPTRVAVDGSGRATPLKGAAPRRRGEPLELREESHSTLPTRPGGMKARPAASDDLEALLAADVGTRPNRPPGFAKGVCLLTLGRSQGCSEA